MNKAFSEVDIDPAMKFKGMLDLSARAVNFTIQHPKTQELMKSKIKFDLVISEIALNEAVFGSYEI